MEQTQGTPPVTRGPSATMTVAGLLPEAGPMRSLALAVLVNSLGSGVFLPVSTIYFTRVIGLSVTQIALGLAIAGVAGLFSGVVLGHMADRWGRREAQVVLISAMGVITLGYVWATTMWQFVLIATASQLLDRGVAAVGAALVAGTMQGPARVRARAHMRVAMYVGMAAGSGLAALALQLDTPAAYRAAIVADALTYMAAAAIYLRLPHVPPAFSRTASGPWLALRDRGYLALTAVLSVLTMNRAVLTIALPLWIVQHTQAPRTMVSLLFTLNAVGCVLLQVAVARRTETTGQAVQGARIAGLGLLAACAVLGAAGGRSAAAAVALLLLGTVLLVVSELLVSSAQFCLGFQLAQEHAQGQYQGVLSTGMSLSAAIAPTLMALLPLQHGIAGWLVLGVLFLASAMCLGPLVARRSRQAVATI